MIVADTPYFRVKDGLRSESTGNDDDATMLCGRPNACPTSWVMTWRIVSPMSSSGIASVRAAGFDPPVSMSRRLRYDRMWLWYHVMSLSMISPVRGSAVLGPTALRTRLAAHLTTEYRISSGSDRKSTRLNSSHLVISYAVFCLKKKRTLMH